MWFENEKTFSIQILVTFCIFRFDSCRFQNLLQYKHILYTYFLTISVRLHHSSTPVSCMFGWGCMCTFFPDVNMLLVHCTVTRQFQPHTPLPTHRNMWSIAKNNSVTSQMLVCISDNCNGLAC